MSKRRSTVAPADVATLVEQLQLMRIRLKNLIVRGERADAALADGTLSLGIQSKATLRSVEDEQVEFEMAVRAWAPRTTAPAEAPLFVQSERILTYTGVASGTSPEVLELFGRTSVPLAAWPYLRADVHGACLELDFPPILLPLVKSPPLGRTAAIVSEGSASDDAAAVRARLLELLSQLDDFLDDRHDASIRRPAVDEVHDAWRSLATNALRAEHASLKRRLVAPAASENGAALIGEAERFVRQVEDALRLRSKRLREEHPEGLVRWNEFAREMEQLLARAARAGLRETGRLPKLDRFRT